LDKGRLIYLEGKIRTRVFEDKAGIKKQTTEILAESFTILGRKNDFDVAEELAAGHLST
jgi:single-strand DNA-binding protein